MVSLQSGCTIFFPWLYNQACINILWATDLTNKQIYGGVLLINYQFIGGGRPARRSHAVIIQYVPFPVLSRGGEGKLCA